MKGDPVIQIENLSHQYERWGHRVRALEEIVFDVSVNEWMMLVGPNGSGKSTLVRLLTGQIPIQDGKIVVAGHNIGIISRRALSDVLFLVHQDPISGTAPGLTVREHLLLADGRHWSGSRSRQRVSNLLESFHLEVDPNQPVETLSGGQRQLLVLLMAKIRPAPIVLLDEPLAALDPLRATLCLEAISLLHSEGKTLVFVTHDLKLATTCGKRTLGLSDGRLVYDEREEARCVDDLQRIWTNSQATGSDSVRESWHRV